MNSKHGLPLPTPKNFDVMAVQDEAARIRTLRVGKRYKHHKDGLYTVTGVSVDEATGKIRIEYMSKEHGYIWSRTLDDFDAQVPRFEKVENVK